MVFYRRVNGVDNEGNTNKDMFTLLHTDWPKPKEVLASVSATGLSNDYGNFSVMNECV